MTDHQLSPGDELFDKTDAAYTITEVHDDGSVTLEIDDGESLHRTATWEESDIVAALREAVLETADGKSEELLAK